MANVWLEYSVNMFDERQVANLAALLLGIAMDPPRMLIFKTMSKRRLRICAMFIVSRAIGMRR